VGMRSRRQEIPPGSVWRQVVLGTEAVYRVLAVDGDHVDVEVRTAPGIKPGMHVRLTAKAVAAMVRVDDSARPVRHPRSV